MERQRGVRADGPLEPFRDGLVGALSASGYSKDRAAQLVRLMVHLSRWLESRSLGPGDLSPEVVEEFFDGFGSRHSWCRSPRSRGLTSRSLVEAVPAMATWPRTVRPSTVTSEAAARLAGSCDTSTAIGRRDAAILSLLARLGLRAGEVARLALDDIDWRAGELRIAGKGGRVERLPLLADTGEAIAAYLAGGRSPASRSRMVFLKAVAPFGPISADVVATVVYFACDRAGIPRFGPHRLRHMVATETLRAGAPLPEVARLLRHAAVSTSAIYAIPDPASAAALARPWPRVQP